MTREGLARQVAARLYQSACSWGVDLRRTEASLHSVRRIRSDIREYERQRQSSPNPDDFAISRTRPVYEDGTNDAGVASGHYFHQDLLVAREIHARQPRRHIDVGSSIYGFVSHVASYREIEVLDVRPVRTSVSGITFIQRDVMNLDSEFFEVTDSLSCLHALEHFGLGRYGDPVRYDGWRLGLRNMTRMLERGGRFYLSVPTGNEQRVEFNAHRVFSLPYLRSILEKDFEIDQLAFVGDDGALSTSIDPRSLEAERSMGATYGCSIWFLIRK